MDENDRSAAIKLVKYRHEQGISEELSGIARQKSDAIEFEHVEGGFDFAQASVGVWQRNGGKHSEAPRKVSDQLRSEFIADPCRGASSLSIIKPDTGACHRINSRGYAGSIHLLDGALRRPLRGNRCRNGPDILDDVREVVGQIPG